MKKFIKILQTNTEHLIIEDENDSDLNEYVEELSKLLSVGNVTILETTTSSHIIRPHKIVSISVTESGRKRKYTKKPKPEPEVKPDSEEDIVSDD